MAEDRDDKIKAMVELVETMIAHECWEELDGFLLGLVEGSDCVDTTKPVLEAADEAKENLKNWARVQEIANQTEGRCG